MSELDNRVQKFLDPRMTSALSALCHVQSFYARREGLTLRSSISPVQKSPFVSWSLQWVHCHNLTGGVGGGGGGRVSDSMKKYNGVFKDLFQVISLL